MNNSRWFAVLQSSFYLMSEAVPIISLMIMHAVELFLRRAGKKGRKIAEATTPQIN